MKKFLIILVASFIFGIETTEDSKWATFKFTYQKTYDNEQEEQYRKQIFLDKLQQIEQHNKNFENGTETYEETINEFSDQTDFELNQKLVGGLKLTKVTRSTKFLNANSINCEVPTNLDWRTKGGITPVKNQLQCGSCWAFSTVAAIEAHNRIYKGLNVQLSEQNLLDCSDSRSNCNGGYMSKAYEYAQKKGVGNGKLYPYQNRKNWYCPLKQVVSKIKSYSRLQSYNENEMKKVVACLGPISVAINAENSMYSYKKGIYYSRTCNPKNLNHAVAVVGYGTDNKGLDYWIVKNSWGDKWGVKGFIKIARNKNNHCGIATESYVPIVQ